MPGPPVAPSGERRRNGVRAATACTTALGGKNGRDGGIRGAVAASAAIQRGRAGPVQLGHHGGDVFADGLAATDAADDGRRAQFSEDDHALAPVPVCERGRHRPKTRRCRGVAGLSGPTVLAALRAPVRPIDLPRPLALLRLLGREEPDQAAHETTQPIQVPFQGGIHDVSERALNPPVPGPAGGHVTEMRGEVEAKGGRGGRWLAPERCRPVPFGFREVPNSSAGGTIANRLQPIIVGVRRCDSGRFGGDARRRRAPAAGRHHVRRAGPLHAPAGHLPAGLGDRRPAPAGPVDEECGDGFVKRAGHEDSWAVAGSRAGCEDAADGRDDLSHVSTRFSWRPGAWA